jgi:hypothetical protein
MKMTLRSYPLVLALLGLALSVRPLQAADPAPASAAAPASDAEILAKAKAKAEHKAARLKRRLEKYDANHNGKLDPEELQQEAADRQVAKEKRQAMREAKKAAKDTSGETAPAKPESAAPDEE